MSGRRHGGERSFRDFYLRQVAISEGCGCAELVIRRDSGNLPKATEGDGPPPARGGSRRFAWLRRLLRLDVPGEPR